MAVGPGDIDARTRRDMNFNGGGFFALVDRNGHERKLTANNWQFTVRRNKKIERREFQGKMKAVWREKH